MKFSKTIVAAALCLFMAGGAAVAQKPTVKVATPASQLMDYLRSQDISPLYDKKDNSVNFKYRNVLYWVTMERTAGANVTLYTLHRNHIKFTPDSEDPGKLGRQRENAVYAANLLNGQTDYKAFLNGNRVQFEFPVYATSMSEYIKVFPTMLRHMEDAKNKFDRDYKAVRHTTDSIHRFWAKNDTSRRVIPQTVGFRQMNRVSRGNNLRVIGMEARNIDAAAQAISDYDDALRTSKMNFLQTKLRVVPEKKGTFKVALKIYDPEGKLLVPNRDARYTTVSTVEFEKSGKEQECELTPFGSTNKSIWKPGEYKIQIFEDDVKIYDDAVHLL